MNRATGCGLVSPMLLKEHYLIFGGLSIVFQDSLVLKSSISGTAALGRTARNRRRGHRSHGGRIIRRQIHSALPDIPDLAHGIIEMQAP